MGKGMQKTKKNFVQVVRRGAARRCGNCDSERRMGQSSPFARTMNCAATLSKLFNFAFVRAVLAAAPFRPSSFVLRPPASHSQHPEQQLSVAFD